MIENDDDDVGLNVFRYWADILGTNDRKRGDQLG